MRLNGLVGFNRFNQPAFTAKPKKLNVEHKGSKITGPEGIKIKPGDDIYYQPPESQEHERYKFRRAEEKNCGPCPMRSLPQNVGCDGRMITLHVKQGTNPEEKILVVRDCNDSVDISDR